MKTNNKLYNMKNKYLRLVVVLSALLLSVSSLWAERVTQEDAALVAANFLNAGDTTSQGAQAPGRRLPMRRVALAEEAQYYVYANADGNGWVMVAANDVVQPILAYSDEGEFRTDKMPTNVTHWLKGYNKQIKYAEENNVEATEEVQNEWKALRRGVRKAKASVVVSPLIKTLWDQDEPYYNLCPEYSDEHALVGCVATAMAQVMNYWQWPVTGTGSNSYTSKTRKLSASANFGTTTYDWANMAQKYRLYFKEGDQYYTSTSAGTTAQQNAVATLMYHCGVAVNMDYDISDNGGSGAQTITWGGDSYACAQNAFWKYFGYKKSTIKAYYRDGEYGYYDSWTDANWIAMLKEELDAQRPIMYAGADSEAGHSFVCDGYDSDSKFHFNWGWSGYCNGYYTVNNMVPGTGGSGAGNGSYNDEQDVIIGIIPDKTDVTITWSVQGVTSTTTQASGTLVLPANPSDCSGANGKKFVGWTESSSVSGSAPADLFTSGSGITVTTNKTYYAVYATENTSNAPHRAKQASATYNKVTATSGITDGQYLIVYEGGSKAFDGSLATLDATSNTISVTISNSAITGDHEGSEFTIDASEGTIQSASGYYIGQTANNNGMNTSTSTAYTNTLTISDGNFSVASSGGAYLRYNNTSGQYRFRYFKSSSYSSQQAIQLYKKAGSSGGGSSTTYSDYALTCTTCSNTPTVTFATPKTVSKTTADASFTKTASLSNGGGQTLKYKSSDEAVATVTNNGVVTIKGKVGSTTITAYVEANGDYCYAEDSYTLTVTAAPINVTLYYNGTSASLTNQTNPYTLPTGSPYNTAMCDGNWTFYGWYGSSYAKSTTEPTTITQLDATGSAYAVYKTTETTSGAPVRKAKMGTTDDVLDLSFTGVSGTSYSAWSGKTGTSGAVYAGNSAGGNDAIQLRSNNSNSGIVTTTTGGTATKVVVTWNSSTDNARSITIYGKNTAYSSAADLYSSSSTTQGTSLGTISKGSTTLNITGSYAYIGIRSTSGALYLDDVTITWSSSGGTTTKTYYATSPDCAVACALTGITLNTSSVTKTFTQDGEFNSTGLVVTASYSNCADKTVSANVTAPSLATTGEKTVTVSYTEGGVTKEATYKINVVAPYTVTYKVCGDVYTKQTYAPNAALVLPEEPGGFDGLTFQGWTATEHHTGASAPADLFSTAGSKTVTADVTYYAVFH